jgi:hypothetical protein
MDNSKKKTDEEKVKEGSMVRGEEGEVRGY